MSSSAMEKSEMTPLFSGRDTVIRSEVRPSMS